MASPQPILGVMVDRPGRYELCFVTHTESGEVTHTKRNVVVEQHGAFFYMRFANEDFQPFECGHEGLRCDLISETTGWFMPVALQLNDDETIESGDLLHGMHDCTLIDQFWVSEKVSALTEGNEIFKVLRPVKNKNEHSTAVNGAAVGAPGLQATAG